MSSEPSLLNCWRRLFWILLNFMKSEVVWKLVYFLFLSPPDYNFWFSSLDSLMKVAYYRAHSLYSEVILVSPRPTSLFRRLKFDYMKECVTELVERGRCLRQKLHKIQIIVSIFYLPHRCPLIFPCCLPWQCRANENTHATPISHIRVCISRKCESVHLDLFLQKVVEIRACQ